MKQPHLLVANDDGIHSFFYRALVDALHAAGFRLSLVAPAREQSWVSRAMSRHRPVKVERVEGFPWPAWSVDGTPTDCVNIGLGHLVKDPVDAIVSGINLGVNVTLPLTMSSGTVAAALEGVFWGKPAFAFSQRIEKVDFERIRIASGRVEGEALASLREAARRSAVYVREGLSAGLPAGVVRSINFPARITPETEARPAHLAAMKVKSLFAETEPGVFNFQFQDGRIEEDLPSADASLLEKGFVTEVDIPYPSLCALKE
jgi:5'-nucleotidase